jgi:tRNA/tmRNA/rRNA uracil-C5-methylase (TrmA/RlmC/RlmD family)
MKALNEFWRHHRLPGSVEPLITSPRPRAYRSNSKRRVMRNRQQRAVLALTDALESGGIRPLSVRRCPIEPDAHNRIYGTIQGFLDSGDGRPLARILNYVILKGTYHEIGVVLSLSDSSSRFHAVINRLSRLLTDQFPEITGVYRITDKPSRYYVSDKAALFRRIHGARFLRERLGDREFRYSPISFSQTNSSIVPMLVEGAADFLRPQPADTLYDLYCGYGLFGLSLAGRVSRVVGLDLARDAIRFASDNARLQGITNARFVNAAVRPEQLERFFDRRSHREIVVLDPPRGGTEKGVIEWLGQRGVARVLHLLCNIELVPQELSRWIRQGYRVSRVVPIDMFPATEHVEIMVQLERGGPGDESVR